MMKLIIFFILFSIGSVGAEADLLSVIKSKYAKEHAEIVQLMTDEEELEEEYPTELKKLYFEAYQAEAGSILKSSKLNPNLENLDLYKSILEGLEYKETETEALSEEVTLHLTNLRARQYSWVKRASIDYISWQREISFRSPTDRNKLLVNSKGTCIGGSLAYENQFTGFMLDGCFLLGNSDVSSKVSPPTYNEGKVSFNGIRLAPGVGTFVSSARAFLGVKLPIYFVQQDIKSPASSTYKVKEDKNLLMSVNVYGRWPLGKAFLQTDIGQFIDQSSTVYAVGLGYTF